ncbi:ABC transporter ATP-binding protein [Pollutimonas bauzanensis]|uniref:Spermidine/putrescine import ATP-binding protein PotA n=1 Tax=Pollutimonas bauzanensis TaxID=658167 RepID=A0A1M5SXZ4_9BURK|nr:ABC transporter ATP-binding protein [Pollutimonas bauzanensis]SHH43210.1 putative spermidine/putrescine transport system ATP-binding protein [Pollutimonas bauzanensis]
MEHQSSPSEADDSTPLVSFRNVQKSYDGETLVVKDLNLDIRHGEFLSLLGPSGSGKTTCLMMLAGFEFPTSGEIMLDGQSLNRVPPHKRNIGMVFQNYALFPHLTVEKNLEYPLSVRKMPAKERGERIAKALEMVQMGSFSRRYPRQLSGGQQQRIALARALVFNPKLVLMDEPLGALDKQLREHMQLELKALHRALGITFVYVTHDQSEALTMSDRVAVFDQGIIQQVSSVDTLYESPCNAFVSSFVGDCNKFSGVVVSVQAGQCAVRLADQVILTAMNINGLSAGASCVVAIRPERLRIVAQPQPNTLPAKTLDKVYFGDHIRLRCQAGGEPSVFVKLALDDHADNSSLDRGAPVFLQAAPQHIRVFSP